jgi:hypothetical protein
MNTAICCIQVYFLRVQAKASEVISFPMTVMPAMMLLNHEDSEEQP